MKMPKRKKFGIFGGSFDPPHNGHVEISKISLKKIKFEKIYWIVAKKKSFEKKTFFYIKTKIIDVQKSSKKI